LLSTRVFTHEYFEMVIFSYETLQGLGCVTGGVQKIQSNNTRSFIFSFDEVFVGIYMRKFYNGYTGEHHDAWKICMKTHHIVAVVAAAVVVVVFAFKTIPVSLSNTSPTISPY